MASKIFTNHKMITKNDLLDRLFFEENLLDVEILEQKEIEEGAFFVMARLEFNDAAVDRYMTLPFVLYDNEDWIFTPCDWQDDFSNITADAIPEIEWRVNNTEQQGFIIDGLPRLFLREPAVLKKSVRKSIGTQIKDAREKCGMTVRELSDKCQVGPGHISRIESGRYNVSTDTLAIIAKVLNIRIEIGD